MDGSSNQNARAVVLVRSVGNSWAPSRGFFGFFVFRRHTRVLKTIPLTLMAVASLIIAAITAKAEDVASPLLGHNTTIGGTTFFYGAPQIIPDPPGNGKWVPFPYKAIPDTPFFLERLVVDSVTDSRNKLNAMVTPPTWLPNGVVVGAGKPTLNHDGHAYAAYTSYQPIAGDEIMLGQTDFAALQAEYRANIKSGKWRKFVNGE